MFRKIEKENPFEEILDQIIENIKEGTLKKGDALPAERNMAEALGVSRPVVREVLRTGSAGDYQDGAGRGKLCIRKPGKQSHRAAVHIAAVKQQQRLPLISSFAALWK